jgi:2-methylcitrate dehydratase PrpD
MNAASHIDASLIDSGASAAIARHVASASFDSLSATTVASTKRALVDGIGVMLAASGMSADVAPFVAAAQAMGTAPVATILGHGDRVGAAAAALANGAMAHALDYEDAFDLAPTHPNASLIPAALATTQALGTVSGKDFITAMAVGCDLSCRLALAVGDALEDGPWYPPPIVGAFGAVTAAAKLRGLDERGINDAFSLMLCQTACPGEIKHSKDTVIRAVREAFPAQSAVIAAELASYGVRGFDRPFEGAGGFFQLFANGRVSLAELLNDLGRQFYVDQLSFKPWPSCRGTHAFIEAAQRLKQVHALRVADIETIRVVINHVQRMLCHPLERKRAPATIIDAKFSIPFVVATALVNDDVTLDSFGPEQLGQREVLAVAQRVEAVDRGDIRHNASGGTLIIETGRGQVLTCEIDALLGSPARPMSDARLREKFIDCASRAARPWSRSRAEAVCDELLALESQSLASHAFDFS